MNNNNRLGILVALAIYGAPLANAKPVVAGNVFIDKEIVHQQYDPSLYQGVGGASARSGFTEDKAAVYSIQKNDTWRNGVSQWLWSAGVKTIAVADDEALIEALSAAAPNGFSFTGNLANALTAAMAAAGGGGKVTIIPETSLAAIHNYQAPQITVVEKGRLSDAVRSVALSYGWNFSFLANWKAGSDYQSPHSYPIVTKSGDISHALAQVIEGFPVKTSLLYSTKTVFVVEDR
ncbi:hypothetical protein M2404_003879 [Rheinheimera pacifica]|uniref:hypothetical protein n=1 Tax=Rheinheimera pacifica TaxID=173990 RepID=UPI00216908E9|nr:hypothetical protein [Rheinheimera pacifica]MCS4309507.1 hypothetical protein [Rheinheimera pacifica]